MRGIALAFALLAMSPAGVAANEAIVAGLSQNRIGISANFDGSEIIVYGAVRRDGPAPGGALDVIVTVEGPEVPLVVRRKSREMGIWINTDEVRLTAAPAFYAIATTAPLDTILTDTDNLRYKIAIPNAIRSVGIAAVGEDAPDFIDALIRIRSRTGSYLLEEGAVELTDETLFRADFLLPANLTEGLFDVRIFLLRGGVVVDALETQIDVRKEGLERFLYRLAHDQPLIYGLLALAIAGLAGWAANAAFRAIRS
jgi:uncharacterized protein (TIGR02186 family)